MGYNGSEWRCAANDEESLCSVQNSKLCDGQERNGRISQVAEKDGAKSLHCRAECEETGQVGARNIQVGGGKNTARVQNLRQKQCRTGRMNGRVHIVGDVDAEA